MIDGCDICQGNHASNMDFQPHQQTEATKPMQYVGINMCHSHRHDILVLIHCNSHYIWTREHYNETKSASTISAVLSVLQEFGTPEHPVVMVQLT